MKVATTSRLARLVPADPGVCRMALATLVNTSGRGIYYTLSALYFTRIVGFSVVEVGLGLSIAAAVALGAGVPIGHLADRRGPREVQIWLVSAIAVASAGYLLVQTWWQFVALSVVVAVLDRGSGAVRAAMIAGLVQGADRAATKAYLRSITNVGMTLGSGIAALALVADTRAAYLAVLYLDVATYVVTALLLRGLPHLPPVPAEQASGMLTALRDRPFMAVVLVSSVLTMHYWILEIAVPLWVVEHTSAPRALVAGLMVVNTLAVVGLQVAVARRVTTVAVAVRATVLSGALFLGACAVYGLSGAPGPVVASLLLVVATAVAVGGELTQAAASFVLSFELPPDHAMGQYQGAWGLGFAISSLMAPTAMALLPLRHGAVGWLALGGLLLAAALATAPAVRWAVRARPALAVGDAPTGALAE